MNNEPGNDNEEGNKTSPIKLFTEVTGILGVYLFLCGWTYTDYFLKTFAVDFIIFGFPVHYFFVQGFKIALNWRITTTFIILFLLLLNHNYGRLFQKAYKNHPIVYIIGFSFALLVLAWFCQITASSLGYEQAKNIQRCPCDLPLVSYKLKREEDKGIYTAFLLMQTTDKLYLLNPQLLKPGVDKCVWSDESVIILSMSEIGNLKLSGYLVKSCLPTTRESK